MKRTYKYWLLILAMVGIIFRGQVFAEAGLYIHFLDVGQADATIVLCDDEVMMIDGGNSGDSSFIYSYLKNTLQIEHIDYMIASHPHEDHIGGLSAALNACTVRKVYSPVLEYDSQAFSSFRKYIEEQGLQLSLPVAGETFSLGAAEVQILGPLKEYDTINDMSIIVRIVYGETSFLFTGDAEWEAEHDLAESGYDISSTLLKVGHHGSDTSNSYIFLRKVMPKYAIISSGKNNIYGHPNNTVLSRLEDIGAEVHRTDFDEDMICYSDGTHIRFVH